MYPSLGHWGEGPHNEVLGVNPMMKNLVVKTCAATFALLSVSSLGADGAREAAHRACHQAVQAKCKGAADGEACRQQARQQEEGCKALRDLRAEHAQNKEAHEQIRQLREERHAEKQKINEEYKAKIQEARKKIHK